MCFSFAEAALVQGLRSSLIGYGRERCSCELAALPCSTFTVELQTARVQGSVGSFGSRQPGFLLIFLLEEDTRR
jgi:hypothetical protein